ncbi:iron-containing redox enzyme family protein [Candidatus Poseidonia alphae]|nr:iron-containing redox enzyme family protein [Candidatus Poseidonia alphae]
MNDGDIAIDGSPSKTEPLISNNERDLNPHAQRCLQQLLRVWLGFERDLSTVPLLRRIDLGTYTVDDHLCLLRNLRQQVIEGSRWITRTASSFDRNHAEIRSTIISHAVDEHRDYELLEKDYVASGGNLNDILRMERNVGSEALHGFLMHRSSRPNPVDLLGAMWIIEGLGEKMARSWAERIQDLTGLGEDSTRFMTYHGHNDGDHMERFYEMLDEVCVDEPTVRSIIKTSRVVARLYRLQLEEVEHELE